MKCLYKKYAKYYDLIYSVKDYGKETRFLQSLIKKNKINGKDVLEVGCGTGGHALFLKKKGFRVVGVDLNKEMLAVARKKTKTIKFVQGDMKSFNLKKKFDIVLCLFSTMHYNQTEANVKKTIKNFSRHLKPGGLLIFDMGFNKERWDDKFGRHILEVKDKDVDIIRVSHTFRKGDKGIIKMAYIIYKNKRHEFAEEDHVMGRFVTSRINDIVVKEGFEVRLYDAYTTKPWNKKSKKYVVLSGVKKR